MHPRIPSIQGLNGGKAVPQLSSSFYPSYTGLDRICGILSGNYQMGQYNVSLTNISPSECLLRLAQRKGSFILFTYSGRINKRYAASPGIPITLWGSVTNPPYLRQIHALLTSQQRSPSASTVYGLLHACQSTQYMCICCTANRSTDPPKGGLRV